MPFGGGASGTTTATQTSQPWGPQQPYLENIFGRAQNLYENGAPQYFPGATVAPMTGPQTAALQGIATTVATDPLRLLPAAQLMHIAQGTAPGDDALASYISGQRLETGNPYLKSLSDSIMANVLPGIQSQFIQGGMLASPEAARASTAGVTSALAPFAFQQYQQEEKNQIDAATAAADRYLKGVALAPSVQGTQYAPLDALFSAGAATQTQNQQDINDAVARWNFSERLPYDLLNTYIGQVTGNYGGTTNLTQPYFSNPGQNMISGGLGGAMLGSSLLGPAGLGLTSAGAGSGIGAGIGALMMMMSDPRVKEDASPVGKLDNGLTVYSYRYIDDPPALRRIGLMADEVERAKPEAVGRLGPEWGALGGMRMVDYARATETA